MKKYHYKIITSACTPAQNCWGRYKRIGLLKVQEGVEATQIREKNGVEVIETWDNLHFGKTERCAYEKTLKIAKEKCERLNKNVRNDQ